MLRIHALNVKHGDSIIIESEHEGRTCWSVLDCHKTGNKIPTIDFLRKRGVNALQCIFLTHLDYDHISGLGDLVEYLLGAAITVEHVFTPVLPESIKVRRQLFKLLYPGDIAKAKDSIEAFHKLQQLTNSAGAPTEIDSGVYIGSTYGTNIWIDSVHPGYEFGFLSPNEQQAAQYIAALISDKHPDYEKVNDLSHVMIVRPSGAQEFFLFPGDLDSERLRHVCNIARRVTNHGIEGNVRFIKAPHHGTFTLPVQEAIDQLLSHENKSYVCVSCRPYDKKHPSDNLLRHIKSGFENCIISCTGLSYHCSHLSPFKKPTPLSLINNKRATLSRHLASKSGAAKIYRDTPCHGTITVERSTSGAYSITSSTGDYCMR